MAEQEHPYHWIDKAISRPGSLRRELHVPAGEKIPEKKLEKAAHGRNKVEAERARLAETLKNLHR